MKFTPRVTGSNVQAGKALSDAQSPESLYLALEPVAKGLGLAILDFSLSRQKGHGGRPGSAQIRVTVYKDGSIGVNDCSGFHRAIMPRLELIFPESDVYLEVSSPGIGRLIKDGSEMGHFIGRNIKCYCTEIPAAEINVPNDSGWIKGALKKADEKGIDLETVNGIINLPFEIIAKAKLEEV